MDSGVTSQHDTLPEGLLALQADMADVLTTCAVSTSYTHAMWTLCVPKSHWLTVAQALRDQGRFETLTDLAAVDYLTYGHDQWETEAVTSEGFGRGVLDTLTPRTVTAFPGRYAVVLHALSLSRNLRVRAKVFLDGEPPSVSSLVSVWPSANWYEREAFDLLGVVFDQHPDLRRLLTDYGLVGYPFRKDFPLEGYQEVRYDPQSRRVVSVPVSIEPRVGVPRVIRQDNRYQTGEHDA